MELNNIYLNKEHIDLFYLFKRYSYSSSEMEVLKEKSIYGINAVDAGVYKYYDLRFIFEIVYKYSGIYDNYE